MSAPLPCEILLETVVSRGLCTRCGTCVGACPRGNLRMADILGDCLPVAGADCDSCGLCVRSCPGGTVNFKALGEMLFAGEKSDFLLGVVKKAYLAHARDSRIRERGASGGVVTALLLSLLEEGKIKGALLYSPQEGEPWRGRGIIAETADEIARAAQSRYQLSPLNAVLGEMAGREGPYAMVGLPCHLHGLMKLKNAGWNSPVSLEPLIGIYCGNNLYFQATRTMLRKMGVGSLEDIEKLSYREGKWPGSFTVKTRDGNFRRISKLDFNQAIPFYINRRCLFCVDLTNELTDISVGDGWDKEGGEEEGWSVVLTRTGKGERIVREAAAAGIIHLEEIDPARAARMHAHAFDLKKTGAFIRLGLWKKWGFSVARYDISPPPVKIGRKIMEVVISLQFIICSSGPGRFLFRLLPVGALGYFFRQLRKSWIKISRKSA
ncbi:MAG: Coenzyme F420 hydrogenase/dehydrogenase, beta subunit C-terminal domain [Candidatus Krumholzibacteriota bacterium]|nr:Coenzyme F420 hydrogenase/dehydrogenase, beta subunit C-terminal domain [Candidatus Krumholzibacteriota bacterium]